MIDRTKKGFTILIENFDHSKEVQETLFKLGYDWFSNKRLCTLKLIKHLGYKSIKVHFNNNEMLKGMICENSFFPIITLSDLQSEFGITEKPNVLSTVDTCTHPNKYKNIVSMNMKFYVCPDCGKDWDIVE